MCDASILTMICYNFPLLLVNGFIEQLRLCILKVSLISSMIFLANSLWSSTLSNPGLSYCSDKGIWNSISIFYADYSKIGIFNVNRRTEGCLSILCGDFCLVGTGSSASSCIKHRSITLIQSSRCNSRFL